MNEALKSIWFYVEVFLLSITIGAIFMLSTVSKQWMQVQQQEVNEVARMKEYREWMRYDEKYVLLQDIVSAAVQQRGNVGITVKLMRLGNLQDTYILSQGTTPPTASSIQEALKLKMDALGYGDGYKILSSIVYNPNGEVTTLVFEISEV